MISLSNYNPSFCALKVHPYSGILFLYKNAKNVIKFLPRANLYDKTKFG